ncbi:MAG: SUMF1/EgtB/PvdO family nonheme iron enzyme, partial [Hyphomicrobium sp.]
MIAPPEMVTLPAGHFMMGSPAHEPGRLIVEGPQRRITIAKPFAVSRYPVMRGAFAAFVAASGYRAHGRCTLWTGSNWHEAAGSYCDPGFDQTDAHPVVCVSWNDGQSYASWLSSVTGNRYRL